MRIDLNLINARALAESRGLELSIVESEHLGSPYSVEVSLAGGMREADSCRSRHARRVAPRLTRIRPPNIGVTPRRTLIVLTNHDIPGVIGRVGTLLGDAGVNIAEYHQARLAEGGKHWPRSRSTGSRTRATRQAWIWTTCFLRQS